MSRHKSILSSIRAAIGRDVNSSTDSELLTRFVENRDDDAFELLVWRHSATVLRVCRSVLRDHHAAEDAAQATFLTFACKASSFKHHDSIVGWLYQTAHRISLRSVRRRPAAILTVREFPDIPESGKPEQEEPSAIHQELAYLPEKYRLPILLSCIEGLSHVEAAKKLGWSASTFSTRIARGKELLQRRLSRRGIVVPVAGIATMLTVDPTGSIAGEFMTATARGAIAFAAKREVAGGVSAAALRMVREEIRGSLARSTLWIAGITAGMCVAFGGVAYFLDDSVIAPVCPAATVEQSHTPTSATLLTAPTPRRKTEPDQETVARYAAIGAGFGKFVEARELEDFELGTPNLHAPGISGFSWKSIPASGLPQLPPVDVPFAISISNTKLTDTDIRRVAQQTPKHTQHMNTCGITDAELDLEQAKGLKVLNLFGNRVSDNGVEKLETLRNLEILNLSYTHAGDRGLPGFSQLQYLRVLYLIHTDVDDRGLQQLSSIRNLEQLHLMQTDITDAGLNHLKSLTNLRVLKIGRTAVTNQGIRGLAPLHQLTHLDLGRTSVTDAGMASLAETHPNLTVLNLFETQITDQGLRNLSPLAELSCLGLTGCPVTGAGVLELTKHPKLEILKLGGSLIKGRDLVALNSLENLRSLSLTNLNIGDRGIQTLTELKNLEDLDLIRTKVVGTGFQQSQFPKLKLLELSGTPVNESGLRSLGSLQSLAQLYLAYCDDVTDEGIQHLAGLRNLKRLDVTGTKVTRAGAIRLNQARGTGNEIVIQGDFWLERGN